MVGQNFGRRARRHFDLGRNNHAIALMLVLLRQVQQLERKPPVTLGLMGTSNQSIGLYNYCTAALLTEIPAYDVALMCGLYYQQNITPELFHPYLLQVN